VLGRGDSESSSREDGYWITTKVMNEIQQQVENSQIESLQTYIPKLLSKPINHILGDIIGSLASIAEQLGKPTPNVKIDASRVLIKNTGFELVTDVFAHILRNCVDHGIEVPEERLKTGKQEQGQIIITALPVAGKLNIFVNDDGRGINIGKLFERGVERGIWKESDEPTHQEIAELIFCSGVSTKDAITDISGRGVGMDAVKQFLTKHGGGIDIMLQNISDSSKGFVPFELVIHFPSKEFFTVDTK
jgi:chemotaxis protein histidine kinase CheA